MLRAASPEPQGLVLNSHVGQGDRHAEGDLTFPGQPGRRGLC